MNHENNVATASGKTDNMPKDYIYCPAADGACPRAPQCLRAIAYRQLTVTEASAKPHPHCAPCLRRPCTEGMRLLPRQHARALRPRHDEAVRRDPPPTGGRHQTAHHGLLLLQKLLLPKPEGRTTHHAQGATGHSQRLPPGRAESRTGVRQLRRGNLLVIRHQSVYFSLLKINFQFNRNKLIV